MVLTSRHAQNQRVSPLAFRSILLPLLLLTLVGCQEKPKPDLRVENLKYSLVPGGARFISGSLHNLSDVDVSSAQVMVSLFDEHNQKIGQMGILVKNINGGEAVPFKEPIDSDADIRAARVRRVLVL